MVKVNLRSTFGYGRPVRYYGPGLVDVPEGLARALGLKEAPTQTEAPPVEGDRSERDVTVPIATPLTTVEFTDLFGVDLGIRLALAGLRSADAVRAASDDDLLAIDGVGPATLKKIRAATQE
jgi:hypothetical protein